MTLQRMLKTLDTLVFAGDRNRPATVTARHAAAVADSFPQYSPADSQAAVLCRFHDLRDYIAVSNAS
jgi:hypothetical protein